MKSSGHGRSYAGILVIAVFAWMVLLGFDGLLTWQTVKQNRARKTFVTIDAVVTDSRVDVDSDSDGTSYRPAIEYEYSFDGQRYAGERLSYLVWGSSRRSGAQSIVDRYAIGDVVPVHVDPDDPGESVLSLDGEGRPAELGLFLLPFRVIALWLLRAVHVARRRRHLTDEEVFRGRFVVEESEHHLLLQRPSWDPWTVGMIAALVTSFVTFLAGFAFAARVGGGTLEVVAAVLAGGAGVGFAWRHRRARTRPERRVHLDFVSRRVARPSDAQPLPFPKETELALDSRKTQTTVNDRPIFEHVLVLESGQLGPAFELLRFRGPREEGDLALKILRERV